MPGPSCPEPTEGQHGMHRSYMGSLLRPQVLPSSSCRDLGEGTQELAGTAHGVDKDPWTSGCPAGCPWAQAMVHTADLGRTPPASWAPAGTSRQHMAYVPG